MVSGAAYRNETAVLIVRLRVWPVDRSAVTLKDGILSTTVSPPSVSLPDGASVDPKLRLCVFTWV